MQHQNNQEVSPLAESIHKMNYIVDMTDTPEAVRLADALEDIAATSSCMFEDEATEAAALLRRIPDLETARNVAIELAAQYAADRDQLRAELEKVRAMLTSSPTPPAQPAVAQGAGFDSDAPLYTQPANKDVS